jgi:propanol-preferring alcohol dehydrogenase
MRAMQLERPDAIEREPLSMVEVPVPKPGPDQLRLRIAACGICHTDLHLVEGEIQPPTLPITPGHQVVGMVEAVGSEVSDWSIGDRAGMPWLYQTCGECEYCKQGQQNLCPKAKFTGFHVDGGFAEHILTDAAFTLRIPKAISEQTAAPLLCAGIIGYRSLKVAGVQPGEKIGLFGFGASAHLAIQVARHWDCEVVVFTRSQGHRELAQDLGATWVGGVDDSSPELLDRAILFAPVGTLVPVCLEKIRPGGTLAINAIYMTPIPEIPYEKIYGERVLRTVANATYQDGEEFLECAEEISIQTSTKTFDLADANQALLELKLSKIDGAGVLLV